jgi:hypothetical protein
VSFGRSLLGNLLSRGLKLSPLTGKLLPLIVEDALCLGLPSRPGLENSFTECAPNKNTN